MAKPEAATHKGAAAAPAMDAEMDQWAADADVFMPEARRASLLSAGSAAAGGRRVSSLGTLHHAGHSESACCCCLSVGVVVWMQGDRAE